MFKTIAYACLLFIAVACATKDPTPTLAKEVAGTYTVQSFVLNNRTVSITNGSMTIAERGERISISDLTVNGKSYGVAGEHDLVKETDNSISIGKGYGVYKDRVVNFRFGIVSGGVEETYIIKASKI